MRKHCAWFAILVLAVLSVGCQATSSTAVKPGATISNRLRHPRVIATITAVLPAADSVVAFRPVLLAVYASACSDVTDVWAVPRRFDVSRPFAARSQLIDVRCGAASVVAVRVKYTGVVVPDLTVPNEPHPTWNLARIGLRHRIVVRRATPGEYGHIVAQHPAPGSVVSFGTTILLVVGR